MGEWPSSNKSPASSQIQCGTTFSLASLWMRSVSPKSFECASWRMISFNSRMGLTLRLEREVSTSPEDRKPAFHSLERAIAMLTSICWMTHSVQSISYGKEDIRSMPSRLLEREGSASGDIPTFLHKEGRRDSGARRRETSIPRKLRGIQGV